MPSDWTVLKHYDANHLTRIALPLGGIGTGTVSLGGRGDLRDWEIMNSPAKGHIPQGTGRACYPSIILSVADASGERVTRLMEGPLEDWEAYLTVKNITNQYYKPYLADGVAASGRDIRLSLAYKF